MRTPRLRISWLMAAVACLAVNFAAIRAVSGLPLIEAELIGLGALPFGNVLALAVVIGGRRPALRPFLQGFGTFGAASLAAYLAWAVMAPQALSDFLGTFFRPMAAALRGLGPAWVPVIYAIAGASLLMPHLLVAWAGGRLSRTYRIVVVRREPVSGSERVPAPALMTSHAG